MVRQFCFLDIYCLGCGKKIELDPRKLADYQRNGYPKFHSGHNNIGKPRPEAVKKKIGDAQRGILNNRYGKEPWNKNTIGIMKPNSGSFQKGWKVKTKIKIALQRLEEQRKAKIEAYNLEILNRPKEKEKRPFGMIMCVLEGKLIKCKKPKAFCQHWNFCHR